MRIDRTLRLSETLSISDLEYHEHGPYAGYITAIAVVRGKYCRETLFRVYDPRATRNMTLMDIARFLGVSRTTAYKLIHSEGFPAIQLPGFKRLIVPKKLFLDCYVSCLRENGYDIGPLQDELTQTAPDVNHTETLAET